MEPAYRVTDRISVGLRLQGGAFLRSITLDEDQVTDFSRCLSYTLNAKYYLATSSSFRPYVGMGLGIYSFAKGSIDGVDNDETYNLTPSAATTWGVYPRVGFDWRRFNFNIDINLLGQTEDSFMVKVYDPHEVTRTTVSKSSHLAATIGFYVFGGGRG